jgi:hypothetical protein
MAYETQKNIRNIRNFEYAKCRKHPTTDKAAKLLKTKGAFTESTFNKTGLQTNYSSHDPVPSSST